MAEEALKEEHALDHVPYDRPPEGGGPEENLQWERPMNFTGRMVLGHRQNLHDPEPSTRPVHAAAWSGGQGTRDSRRTPAPGNTRTWSSKAGEGMAGADGGHPRDQGNPRNPRRHWRALHPCV